MAGYSWYTILVASSEPAEDKEAPRGGEAWGRAHMEHEGAKG